MTSHVVLLGLMGSGKTSIGQRVAKRMHRPLLDGDVLLEERTRGRTAADISKVEGIDALHRMEQQVALDALASATPSVVGPAASTIESPEVLEQLRAHFVVWLVAPPELLAQKAVRKTHRPLLDVDDVPGLFARQLATRDPLARSVAALVIDVSRTGKDAAAKAIVSAAAAAG